MLSRADVAKIAALARLPLSAKAAEQTQRDLASIFAHFARIQKIATENVATSDDMTGLTNVMHPDQARPEELCPIPALLDAAPSRANSHIKVKAVFE